MKYYKAQHLTSRSSGRAKSRPPLNSMLDGKDAGGSFTPIKLLD